MPCFEDKDISCTFSKFLYSQRYPRRECIFSHKIIASHQMLLEVVVFPTLPKARVNFSHKIIASDPLLLEGVRTSISKETSCDFPGIRTPCPHSGSAHMLEFVLGPCFVMYSKTCVKRPLLKRQKMVFKTDYRLMQVKGIAEMLQGERSAILSTFIKLPFIIKTLDLSILSGSLIQVFIKTLDLPTMNGRFRQVFIRTLDLYILSGHLRQVFIKTLVLSILRGRLCSA